MNNTSTCDMLRNLIGNMKHSMFQNQMGNYPIDESHCSSCLNSGVGHLIQETCPEVCGQTPTYQGQGMNIPQGQRMYTSGSSAIGNISSDFCPAGRNM